MESVFTQRECNNSLSRRCASVQRITEWKDTILSLYLARKEFAERLAGWRSSWNERYHWCGCTAVLRRTSDKGQAACDTAFIHLPGICFLFGCKPALAHGKSPSAYWDSCGRYSPSLGSAHAVVIILGRFVKLLTGLLSPANSNCMHEVH